MSIDKLYEKRGLLVVIGVVFVFVCYVSFLPAPFYFDDFYNIVYNKSLKGFYSALKCTTGGFRPLAYLSFYIDRKLFGLNPFYFRLENVILHLVNFILVYHLFMLLLSDSYERGKAFAVSFFAAVFWALNPINSQTVAYLVQRMGEVATLFAVSGFYFFVRFLKGRGKSNLYGFFLMLFLGLGFKEIAVLLLPLSMLYYAMYKDFKKGVLAIVFVILIPLTIVLTVPALHIILPLSFLTGKPISKGFTIFEKALTSFKVISDYILVFLFPVFKNIHLYYDMAVEKTVFSTGVVIPFLFIFSLFLISVFFYKKNRLIAFSFAAFLLLVFPENAFLPLDLAYQHRMYFPSVFLSLAIFLLIDYLISKEKVKLTTISIYILFLAINLFTRGVVFSTPKWFYKNELRYAKHNKKVYINASKNLLERGNLEDAKRFLDSGLKLFPDNELLAMNMGLYYAKRGMFDNAIYWYKKAIKEDNPFLEDVYWSLAVLYLEKRDLKNARKYLEILKKTNYSPKRLKILEDRLNKISCAK